VSILPYAISTQLYRDQTLARDHLVEIAAHGFERIEILANSPHFDQADGRATAEIEEALADTGLVLHSVHAPMAESLAGRKWGAPFSIAHGEAAARARAVEEVHRSIALASRLGAGIVVVHVGVPDSLPPAPGDNRPDAVRKSLEELHEKAEQAEVTLALEVIPNRLSTPEALVRLIEEDLELPGLGICLDVGHANLGGDVLDAIETVSGHVVTTHVHDNGGRSDDHLLPFEGRIGWDAALMALQKIGYDGALVFELAAASEPRAVLERAQKVRARFEELLGAGALE
jgi:sugar phosphate isomerase/epimerase